MKIRLLLLLIIALIINNLSAFAQNKGVVKGKVTDETGQPAIGVNVLIVGTSAGTATDVNGNYSLSANVGAQKIQFSGVGYKTIIQDISVSLGETTTLDITINTGTNLLNDVVVTTSRQPIRKIESTTAIDVLEARDVLKQVPLTIGDALRFTPGVYVVSQRGRMRTNLIMRGFPENLGSEDKYTAMLIDGLPAFPGSANAYDQFYSPDLNMERIEVVRGASATLFGRNAAAGVYNVIMRTGGEKLHGAAEVGFSPSPANEGTMYKADLNLNGAITKQLRFNLGGFYLTDPGYRRQIKPDEGYQFRANLDYLFPKGGSIRLYGGVRDFNLFNNVDVPFTIDGKSMLSGATNKYTNYTPLLYNINYTRPTGITVPSVLIDPTNPTGGTLTGNAGNIENGNVGRDNERGNYTRGWNIGLKFNFDLGAGFSLQNHFRVQSVNVGAGSIIGFNYANLAAAQIFNSTGIRELNDVVNELVIRKQVKIGESKHLFTLGAYYGRYTQKTRASGFLLALNLTNRENIALTPIIPTNPGLLTTNLLRNSDLDATVVNSSVFFGDEMMFADDKLKINVGLRYDVTDLDILNYLPKSSTGTPAGVQFPSSFTDTRKVNIGAFSGTLGINYLVGKNSALYGNFVRAFRAPDEAIFSPLTRVPSESIIRYTNSNQNSAYAVNIDKPERISNVELGFRTALLDGDLSFDLATYYTAINNRLISSFREVAPNDIRAIAISEGSIGIAGAELSLTYTPSSIKGLVLRSNLTFQRSTYTEFKNFIYDNRTSFVPAGSPTGTPATPIPVSERLRDVTGNRVKNIPGMIWNWGASYETKVSNSLSAGLGIDGNLMADRYADEMNFIKLNNVMLV
ncbi:MAG: TonB-dependent receptor, partial [Thermoflexibacter sp.]|nr:TonB-dependent receptor [Thermoflexibacter sp.]